MTVFSGIRPSGDLHIGNYIGAIKQWLTVQREHDMYACIVDLHAITTPYQPTQLATQVYNTVTSYLAAGLDPERCTIFVQSHVPQHTELAWLLGTLTPVGDLTRMHQYKEKSEKHKQNANAGLLTYPVLMAADILLYKARQVPVGEDQVQHVELTREIAKRFNQRYGKTFPHPQEQLMGDGAFRIKSLQNPEAKMSKTDTEDSYIGLFDNPAAIRRKIRKAVTDTGNTIAYQPERKPGIANLLAVYSHFSGTPMKQLEKDFSGAGYADFKQQLAELLVDELEPFRRKKKELSTRGTYVEELLARGAKEAKQQAADHIAEVKRKMGL